MNYEPGLGSCEMGAMRSPRAPQGLFAVHLAQGVLAVRAGCFDLSPTCASAG